MRAILETPPQILKKTRRFRFEELKEVQTNELGEELGRVEIWQEPNPSHTYVWGSDSALGLIGRDYDAAICLDVTPLAHGEPAEQVCELHGHWGELFDRVLYAAMRYFHDGFLVGERQFGLPMLRRLYNDYEYCYLYWDRREEVASRRITDKLGYWRASQVDVALRNLRQALIDHKIQFRSRTTISQMGKLQYAPKTGSIDPADATDQQLGIKLAGGGSPDLVMAGSYAWHAAGERKHYDNYRYTYKPGSFGAVLGHDDDEREAEREREVARKKERRAARAVGRVSRSSRRYRPG